MAGIGKLELNPLQIPTNDPRAAAIDFRPLGQIGEQIGAYRRGQEIRDTIAGVTDANGNIDLQRAGAALMKINAVDEARPLMELAIRKQQLAQSGGAHAEAARHNQAMEGLAREQFQAAQKGSKTPPGFMEAPDGGITFRPGGPADPFYIQQITNAKTPEGALLTDAELKPMAEQVIHGDSSPFVNLGRGVQGSQNIVALRKVVAAMQAEKGISGAEQASRVAEFQGEKAGQRTLGTRSANIELPAAEFQQMAPLALAASEKVDRTKYPTLNSLILAYDRGTGDENVVRFAVGANTLANIYARAVSPTGVATDELRKKGQSLLDQAYSKGQFGAAVDMMQQEIAAARRSPGSVRQQMRENFTGKPAAPPTTTPAAPPAAEAPAIQKVQNSQQAMEVIGQVKARMQQRIQQGFDPQTELNDANAHLRSIGAPPISGP